METLNMKIRFPASFESSKDLPILAHVAAGTCSGLSMAPTGS